MIESMSVDELFFFNAKPAALPLYEAFRESVIAGCPDPFLTITFWLPYRKESARIDVATEAYPNRWTHHVMIGTEEEIDDELLSWIMEASDFAERK